MEKADQRSVRARAGYRCEYCHFPEAFAELPFHLDHIIGQQHGGEAVLLFNPRQQLWDDHFVWRGARIFGTTPCGRATIQLLQINRADAVAVRGLLMQEGVFFKAPPPSP